MTILSFALRTGKIAVLFFMMIFTIGTSRAQHQSPTPSGISADQPATSKESAQIEVLKAQVELMRSHYDSLLTTVYWALGVALTIVVVVIGLGWYTNFRAYKGDLAEIRQKITREVATAKSNLEAELRSEVTSQVTNSVSSELRDFKRKTARLRLENLKIQSSNWENSGSIGNAIHSECYKFEEIDSLYDWEVTDILERIRKLVLLDPTCITTTVIESLGDALNKLPERNAITVKVVMQLAADALEGKLKKAEK